ncbi:MAG: aminoglycoside phosphotransferase family protein [Myxococcota bacterium]
MSSEERVPEVEDALHRLGLLDDREQARCVPLAGGVSSDIWRIDRAAGPICVKRARRALKVAAHWQAPVTRNAFEVAWIEAAAAVLPESVPRLLGHLPEAHLFVMEYLDPKDFSLWKAELRAGRADPSIAAEVGRRIASIHAATAGDAEVAERFDTSELFTALRLEPYFLHTAELHCDLEAVLHDLVARTLATRLALIHGDVSPKNIVLGSRGPVFLDAECAWYGDPAFDLAFCLNHLLLKCLWVPRARTGLLECFDALREAYLGGNDWEPRAALEERAAHLLPALLLARVDGKSPVEYLDEGDREVVRRAARSLLFHPVDTLSGVRAGWSKALDG